MRRLVVLLVGLITLLGACNEAGNETTDAGPGGGEFPVTVSVATGSVTIERRPERIVSLSATHTEVLYAIGAADRVIATDLTSNYPAAAEATTKLDSFNFNVEEVAALDPDLVVIAFDFQGEAAALEALSIPHLLLEPAVTLGAAYEQIVILGNATGNSVAARNLVDDVEQRIEAAIEAVPAPVAGMTVYHEVDATYYSANSATLLGDVYSRLGLENLADGVPDEFGSGYVQLSAEAILDADPDFIVLGDTGFGVDAGGVAVRPGWETLDAVVTGRILELDSDIAGRWGPRTADMVERIAAWVTERSDS